MSRDMSDLLLTYMEMTAPPQGKQLHAPINSAVIRRVILSHTDYVALYRAVGSPWQWDDRLTMLADTLQSLLQNPTTHLYLLLLNDEPLGLCEFVEVGKSDVELTNFGLIPQAQGRRLGPFLLDYSLRLIWMETTRRVWLHTDTNDHPAAQKVYQRAGFRVYAERWESS
jgi:ribosomal protein S18 acetylase RimI-like enzyme